MYMTVYIHTSKVLSIMEKLTGSNIFGNIEVGKLNDEVDYTFTF